MTDDLYPTTTLPTALRTLADSGQPPVMDVERVLQKGQHSLARRRLAALGGGTAVLAATGLLVGVLAPAGSLGHRGSTVSAAPTTHSTTASATSATSAGTGPATPTSNPTAGVATPLASPDPHDPAVTHWQFGYLPQGMAAYGGGSDNSGGKGLNAGTVTAYDSSGFSLLLYGVATPSAVGTYAQAPTMKIPATVTGATQAFWRGYPDGRITIATAIAGEGDYAMLDWQRPDGQWLEMIADNVGNRADWEAQALKAAAHVFQQDRPVPLPVRLAVVPQGYTFIGGSVTRANGATFSQLTFSVNPDQRSASTVQIVAFTTGSMPNGRAVPPQNKNSCADSRGLTVCVSSPTPLPAGLTAVGGTQGLLNTVTSLGNDPANWTTDVLP